MCNCFCRIDRLDADKSGVIEADELKNALRAVGQHPMQLGQLSWESKGMPRPPQETRQWWASSSLTKAGYFFVGETWYWVRWDP